MGLIALLNCLPTCSCLLQGQSKACALQAQHVLGPFTSLEEPLHAVSASFWTMYIGMNRNSASTCIQKVG